MILALALADIKAGGWFGKVVKGKKQGTSNVEPVTGNLHGVDPSGDRIACIAHPCRPARPDRVAS